MTLFAIITKLSARQGTKTWGADGKRTLKTIQRKRGREAELRRSGKPGSEEAEREKKSEFYE